MAAKREQRPASITECPAEANTAVGCQRPTAQPQSLVPYLATGKKAQGSGAREKHSHTFRKSGRFSWEADMCSSAMGRLIWRWRSISLRMLCAISESCRQSSTQAFQHQKLK